MTKTDAKVEFKQEGKQLTARLNGCSIRMSQYDDGRWFVAVDPSYEIRWSCIEATREEAEAKAIEMAKLGKDGIKECLLADLEEQIRGNERHIEGLLAEMAELDINRAITHSTGFKAGFKAGQDVLRHIVWNVIGGPDEL